MSRSSISMTESFYFPLPPHILVVYTRSGSSPNQPSRICWIFFQHYYWFSASGTSYQKFGILKFDCLYLTLTTFLQYRPKKRNFGDFEIIIKQVSFDIKLSAIIEDKVSSHFYKIQLDRLNLGLLWTRQASSWHIWIKIMRDMIHQLSILTAQKILTSFYYPDNQQSSLIIFHRFISCFIKTQFFTPGVPPQVSKKTFCRFFIRCLYSLLELSVLITNITLFLKIGQIIRKIWSTFWEP
jgi:hypothetical protein